MTVLAAGTCRLTIKNIMLKKWQDLGTAQNEDTARKQAEGPREHYSVNQLSESEGEKIRSLALSCLNFSG